MKCEPGEIHADAVVEYAKFLADANHKANRSLYTYDQCVEGGRVGYRAMARRAISDGACPSGWEWAADTTHGPHGLTGIKITTGHRLIRKPTPTPPDPVAEAARETDEAMSGYKGVANMYCYAALDAIRAEMRARAAKGGGR